MPYTSEQLERQRKYNKEYRQRLRAAAIERYGGRCSCCGEQEQAFLAIDHVGGGGTKWRREKGWGSYKILVLLRDLDYPDEFRLLCHNCNYAEHFVEGGCPHRDRQE